MLYPTVHNQTGRLVAEQSTKTQPRHKHLANQILGFIDIHKCMIGITSLLSILLHNFNNVVFMDESVTRSRWVEMQSGLQNKWEGLGTYDAATLYKQSKGHK